MSDKNASSLIQLQETEQALQLNQDELKQKNTLIVQLQAQLNKLAQEPVTPTEESKQDLSNMLLEKVEQDQQIMDLTEQLTTLRKLVQDALSTYVELTKSVVTIPFDMAINYGQGTSIGSYILSMVLLFHIWKTVLRIPNLLRSDSSEYLYLLPNNVQSSKLFSIIPSELKDAFISKIMPDDRMRIDIILYFLIAGLVEYKNGISNNEPLTEVYTYMEKLIEYTTKNLYDIMNTLRKQSSTTNKPNRMISFVRLSSTTPTTNDRFKVNVVNQRTMNIQYSQQPIPFYEPDKKNASEWVRNNTPINYNADYRFGPFTKIYNTTDRNRSISEDQVFREQIEAQLRQLKPVCIIGHGSPGSGKTTTLIHASYTTVEKGVSKIVNEHGILLLLADQLSKDTIINGVPYQKFDECQVSIYELAADTSSNSPSQTVCYKYPESENPLQENRSLITSIRESDNYTRKFVEGTVSYDNCEDSTTRYTYTIGKNGTWTDIEGNGMDSTMLDAIDKNRSIASTNSNPQSSRSHTICILSFLNKKTLQITTLIVCDFAGGENKFNCSDPKELDKIGVPTLVELEKKRIIKSMTQSIQYPELQEGIINGSLLNDITGIPILSLKKYIELSQYVKRITDLFSKKIKIKVTSSNQKDDPYHTYSSWFETGKPPQVSTQTEVPLDISLIKNYKLVDTTNAQTSFPKKSYINLYYGFIIDPDNKALLQLLIKLYSIFTKDTGVNSITDLLIPELVKLIVWFNHSFNHYNLMFHSLLSLHINPNTKLLLSSEDIKKGVKLDLCNIRNKEGLFINYTLNQFRDFISNLLRTSNDFSFIDECASIQCNPNYRDCFGQNPYGSTSSTPNSNNYGELTKYIMNVPNAQEMIFCIINVLNLSKSANNPPPTPYLDITELMIERERMKNYLSSSLRTEEFALRLSKPTVSSDILKRLIRNPLLLNMPEEFKKIVLSLSNDLLNGIGQPMEKLETLIQSIENSNGVTSIGSMKFIDDMSKGGYTPPTCNLQAQ